MLGTRDKRLQEAILGPLYQRLRLIEMRFLEQDYPDWSDIVGRPSDEGAEPPETPFRTWLRTKSDLYRSRVEGTDSPIELSRAIARFQRETTEASG
jgi:hypothetical protein